MANGSDADGDLFEVEQILRKSKSSNGVIIYKVRWKGYGPDEDTWEPRQNLESCQDLIVEFERKQSELAKKRAEQRRANKALQEERVVECESSDESNGVYPSTFKNTFWKELEAGRVDLFGNDMYSKVKAKRAATGTSHSKSDSSNSDDGQSTPEHEDRHNSSLEKESQTNSQKKSSTGRSRSRRSVSEYGMPGSVKSLSDTESDENCDTLFNNSNTNITNKDSSDSDVNAVTEGVDEVKFAETSPVPSPSYTLLPKTTERKETSSKKKKKKGHKHKKSTKKRKTPNRNDRKRKISSTSLPDDINEHCAKGRKLDDERSGGSLEGGDIEEVCESDLRLECKDNDVDDSGIPDSSQENENAASSVKDKHDEHSPAAPSNVQEESRSPDLNQDYTHTPPHRSDSPESLFKDMSNIKVDSVDSGLGGSASDISVQTPGETDGSVFTNFTDSVSSVEASRKSSDAFDSGLCSPVSERGSVRVGRDSKPKTDTYPEPLPSALSGGLKSSNKGRDQGLEIDLDDLDWEMFDREVSMEPINISNFEFAEAVRGSNYEVVKRALKGDGKYDMNAPDFEGKTLLMHTVQQGNDHISDLLIENGADINAQTHHGLTPLMIACQCAEVSTVNLLLELGAKINMAASDGRTALITAAKRGHTLILWLLLECGANFNMVTVNGHNAMDYIKHLQHTEMENMLANHIHRVMSEFNKQVSITMNQTAKIVSALFPPQLYNVCDGDKFEYTFHHNLLPPNSGMGYLLFIGQAVFTSEEVQCRLYGPCAVKSVFLNGHQQSKLTEGGNFVLAFSPLVNGRNVITINTVKAQEAKAKLIMCAYKAQILEM